MQLEQVDVVGAEPAQRRLHRVRQVVAGAADRVGVVAGAEGRLGRDQHLVATPLDRGPQHLLGRTGGVDVGAVEQGEPGIEADVDQPAGLVDVGVAPGAEKLALAAESPGAEAEHGDAEAGSPEPTMFHDMKSCKMHTAVRRAARRLSIPGQRRNAGRAV